MEFEIELPKNITRVWDLDVPIIRGKYSADVYITDQIDAPFLYNELCFMLKHASKHDTINLHLNTPGGHMDSAFMIIDAIKQSKAKVIANLYGTVASAGTIIALVCDDLVVSDHVAFMAHNYSAGMIGKGNELKARQNFNDKSLEAAFRDIYKGFFTPKEMQEIIDGQDYWLDKDEVLTRWRNHKVKLDTTDTLPTSIEPITDVVAKPRRGRPRKSQI